MSARHIGLWSARGVRIGVSWVAVFDLTSSMLRVSMTWLEEVALDFVRLSI